VRRTPTDAELEEIAQRRGWPLPMVVELVRGSAINEQVLVDAKVHFVVDPKSASKRFGRPAKEWESRVPAWFVPYFLPGHDDPVLERAKPTKPFVFKDKKDDGTTVEKTQKYAQRKDSGVHLFFGPNLLHGPARTDCTKAIVITEGEKKTLACESAGVACLGLGGVANWHRKGEKTLHPSFAWIEDWEGRDIFLAFDRDSLENAQVRSQELELGRKIEAKGAKVYLVRFPAEAGKLDDFLATHDVEEFHALLAHAKANNPLPPDTSTVTGAPAPGTALTDLGNAERMLKLHGDDLRYCEAIGAWYRWTGKRWERDTTQQVIRRAMATVRSIYAEADAATDVDARMRLRQHAQNSESHARISATVKLLSVMASVSVRPEQFDADPWLVNCENGTVDLRTGQLRQHQRADLITRVAPVKYDPAAKHDLWVRFLMEATGGDLDMIAYLQRAVGYSLTGSTREDKLFFIYGPGGRGKGTFVNAILAPLGEYARVADISSFLERRDAGGDKPRPDLVRLMGSRIALCDEVKRDARLDEGLVKTITGGSALSVRTLNKEGFEMVPSFKLWLVANDPPIIHAEDTGMWRRMVRIPFTNAPEAPDTQLRDTLKSDPAVRAAVFAWAVAGVQQWLEHGLREPKAILESNAAYHAEMDPVGEFFRDNCVIEEGATISRKELRSAYDVWCKEEGHLAVGARRFSARLREAITAHGFDARHSRTSVRVMETGKALDREGRPATREVVRDGWRFVRMLSEAEREGRSRVAAAQHATETATKAWGQEPKVLDGGAAAGGSVVSSGAVCSAVVSESPIPKLIGAHEHDTSQITFNHHLTTSLQVTTTEGKYIEEEEKTAVVSLVANGTPSSLQTANSLQDKTGPEPDNDNGFTDDFEDL
jgi:putative DNA primase/helicase